MHRAAAFLTMALFETAAHAEPSRPAHSVFLRNTAVGRVNPVGLIDFAQISYRRRLYVEEEAALVDNFVGIGLAPMLSPAFARIGPIVEFQPATVLSLWASYEVIRYFGTFNFVQSFPSVNSDFSDTELDRRGELPKGDPLRHYAATGTQLNLGANAQVKVGPVAVRNLFRLFRPDYDARNGDRVVYDIVFDVLAPNGGWVVNNDLDVLYVTKGGLSAGVRWTSNFAYYQAKHFLPGEDTGRDPNTPMHRLGPLLAYSFWKDRGGAFDNPTILFIANWWLEHRYRTGADVSRALPYVVLGFQFTGDLLPHPPAPERLLNGLPKEEIPVAPSR
jgi:hypothetical protein